MTSEHFPIIEDFYINSFVCFKILPLVTRLTVTLYKVKELLRNTAYLEAISFIDSVVGEMTCKDNQDLMPQTCEYIIRQKTTDVTNSLQ